MQQQMMVPGKGNSKDELKTKANEAVSQITSLLEEYEITVNNSSNEKDAEKIKKLEEKNEAMQDKFEKLMNEKMGLLEKQHEGMQREQELRHELSSLKSQQTSSAKDSSDSEALKAEIITLKKAQSDMERELKETKIELKEKAISLTEKGIALKEEEQKLSTALEQLKVAKDAMGEMVVASSSAAVPTPVDLESEEVQTYTNQKIAEAQVKAAEDAFEKAALQQKEVVDDLQKELDAARASLEEKDVEIQKLQEDGRSKSPSNHTDGSSKPDVKSMMSTIYDRIRQAVPADNADLLKSVRLVLKQVAAEYVDT